MTPVKGGGAPTGKLAEAITRDFGSLDAFKTEFKNAGLTQVRGWGGEEEVKRQRLKSQVLVVLTGPVALSGLGTEWSWH